MGIILVYRQSVQFQLCLIHTISKCSAHCIQPAPPGITVWVLYILQEDSATSLVLQLHQFLIMFSLLMRLVEKVFGKVLLSHIIPAKTARHGWIEAGAI